MNNYVGGGLAFGNRTSHFVTDIGTFNKTIISPSLTVGKNSKGTHDTSIVLGPESSSTAENSIAIGVFVSATHKNSIVIGSNASSTEDDSVTISNKHTSINDVKFDKESVKFGKDVTLIFDYNPSITCGGCGMGIKRGMGWMHSGYMLDNIEYKDIEVGLCFDCIYDCVLNFKSKQYWDIDSKNRSVLNDQIDSAKDRINRDAPLCSSDTDPLDKIRADIEQIKNVMGLS